VPKRVKRSLYSGRWWVDCYIWYSEEGTGRSRSPFRPLLAVPNVTAHPSTASVQLTILLYNGPLLCGFSVPIKGLKLPEKINRSSRIIPCKSPGGSTMQWFAVLAKCNGLLCWQHLLTFRCILSYFWNYSYVLCPRCRLCRWSSGGIIFSACPSRCPRLDVCPVPTSARPQDEPALVVGQPRCCDAGCRPTRCPCRRVHLCANMNSPAMCKNKIVGMAGKSIIQKVKRVKGAYCS